MKKIRDQMHLPGVRLRLALRQGEALESPGAALQNAGKSMMCCTGCMPAVLIPDQKVRDLSKCPKCGSSAVKKDIVEHQVP